MSDRDNRLDLGQLRTQAKELLKAVKQGEEGACARALQYFRGDEPLTLVAAQLVIARENGYASWAEVRRAAGEAPRPDPSAEIFEAIEGGDIPRVARLIAASPDLVGVWRRTEYGGWESTLHVAAGEGSLELVRLLVEAGADVYPSRQSDYPPVFRARMDSGDGVAEFLLAASAERDHGRPPTFGCGIDIVLAARLGMRDRVVMHIEKDPFAVFRRGCIGETVLHWPAHNGYVDVVEALIGAGAVVDADEIGLYGGKPLHWAAEHEPGCVRVLLAHGADPNSRNFQPGGFEGFTPLHMCASQPEECVENAELLLEAGADLHARDAGERTPYDVAVLNGRRRMAEYLASREG
jgi:hypothetical protein